MEDLADTPAPPPRVDVPRAVTTARRQARRRAWTTTAAAAVLVVGLAVGATYAINGAPVSPGPGPGTMVNGAPQRFDPLVQYASFGWLPEEDRMNTRDMAVNGELFMMSASEYVPDPANGPTASLLSAAVVVKLYAAGIEPQTEEPLEVTGSTSDPAVPTVNGTPAYWVTEPHYPESTILKWRYAPDAWAEVYVTGFDGDPRQSALRTANELRTGGTEPLRFPFHITGLPAGLHPVRSTFHESALDQSWKVDLDFNTRVDLEGSYVRLRVDPLLDSEQREPNTTVDGHPARREWPKHLSDDLFVYDDVADVETRVLVSAKTAADLDRLGTDGAASVYSAITLHPDRADWTDQPLR